MTNHTDTFRPALRTARTLAALLLAGVCGALQAAPTSPQVVSGQATFVQQGNVFSITNTPNAIINWQSFNIGAGEVTRFLQQSSDSTVLNRIVGQDPSRILGALQSNGHVFLINPNGIVFGRDARIDVNGLTASTLGLTNADFLAGKNTFQASATAGSIDQQGSITTPSGGKVFLIASGITNSGIITSPQGQIALAAGHTVQLVDSSNPDLHVVVSAPTDQAINLGQLIAQGGKVGIYGALVNQRGVVNANSAQLGANGQVVLRASRDAMLEAGSVTSATGAGVGGQVSVTGERVGVTGNAVIDVSGASGGGTVLLGGGYQGKDPSIRNALETLFGKDAVIRADATLRGDGGKVVLWSEKGTRATGRISASGGPLAGRGGLVETSGKLLDVNGLRVNAGTWLLDPYNIDVVATGGNAPLSDVDDFLDLGTSSVSINASTLESVSPGTNIRLQATNDINFLAPINASLGAGSLTAEAGNNINVSSAINTGGGALTLTANHPDHASGSGMVITSPNGALDTGGGALNLSGQQVQLGATVTTRDGNLTIQGNDDVKFARNVSSGNGNFSVTGNNISFGGIGTSADSGTGSMFLNSTGGTFDLGATWTLSSASQIAISGDVMQLQGNIGQSQGTRPSASFTTYTSTRDLDLTTVRDGTALQIDPAWLARMDLNQLFLGDVSHAGAIHVNAEYSGSSVNQLTINSAGDIWINKPLLLSANSGSKLELLLSGTFGASAIHTGANSGDGRLAADKVVLRANNMMIESSITGTGSNGGEVTLMPHMGDALIHIGVGATDDL
ncbi:MAG: filamentous hemagglutinin N-terminal domain-containing protein, partial [Massilia sp.]